MSIALLMQLQHLRVLIKSLAVRLELKHCVVLITFATIRRPKRHCALKMKLPQLGSQRFLALSSHLGGRAKRLASSSEANVTGGVVLTSPVIKKRSFSARVLQLGQPSTRPPRVTVLDRVSSVNSDL